MYKAVVRKTFVVLDHNIHEFVNDEKPVVVAKASRIGNFGQFLLTYLQDIAAEILGPDRHLHLNTLVCNNIIPCSTISLEIGELASILIELRGSEENPLSQEDREELNEFLFRGLK